MSIFKRLDASSQLQVNELIELLNKLNEEASNDNSSENLQYSAQSAKDRTTNRTIS